MKTIRATTLPQRAGAYYVRIQAMAVKHHIPLEQEFDAHDTDESRYIVILDDVLPVATGRMFPVSDDVIQFGRIVVLPEYRYRGLGSQVVRESEAWARELGYKKAVLNSRDNKVEFYKKLGYQDDGNGIIFDDPFYCMRMEKDL